MEVGQRGVHGVSVQPHVVVVLCHVAETVVTLNQNMAVRIVRGKVKMGKNVT